MSFFSDRPFLFELLFWRRPALKPWSRSLALLVILSFIWPFVAWAFESPNFFINSSSVPQLDFQGKPLGVPAELGLIRQGVPGNERLVIHVQDLHCNYEVQMNVSRLIDHFSREYGLRLVGEEGACDTVNVSKFKSFPDRKASADVSDYFVRQGKLSGAEHYAINGKNRVHLEGIEIRRLYQENFRVLKFFFTHESQGYCQDLREGLDEVKGRVYSSALRRFDAKRTAYRQGELDLLRYAAWLQTQARGTRVDLSPFATLNRYLSLGQKVFGLETDPDRLFAELDALDTAIRRRLYTDPAERELDEWTRRLDIVERLINISATPEEVKEFRAERSRFAVRNFAEFFRRQAGQEENALDPEVYQLDGYLSAVEEFYRLTDQRSVAFVDNLLRKMDRRGERLALMLTGGFHTEAVVAELQRRGVACLSITPRQRHQDLINPYFSLLQNRRTPLEKLLAKNQNIFALPTYLPDGPFEGEAPVPKSDLDSAERRLMADQIEELMRDHALAMSWRAGERDLARVDEDLARNFPCAELLTVAGATVAAEDPGVGTSAGSDVLVLESRVRSDDGPLRVITTREPVDPKAVTHDLQYLLLGQDSYFFAPAGNVRSTLADLSRARRGSRIAAWVGALRTAGASLSAGITELAGQGAERAGRFMAWLAPGGQRPGRLGQAVGAALTAWGTWLLLSVGGLSAGPSLVVAGAILLALPWLAGPRGLRWELAGVVVPRLDAPAPESLDLGRMFYDRGHGRSRGVRASRVRARRDALQEPRSSLLGHPLVKFMLMVGSALFGTVVLPQWDPLFRLVTLLLWVMPGVYVVQAVFTRRNLNYFFNLLLSLMVLGALFAGYFAIGNTVTRPPPAPAQAHAVAQQALDELIQDAERYGDLDTLARLLKIHLVFTPTGIASDGAFYPGNGVFSIPDHEVTLPDFSGESEMPIYYLQNTKDFFKYLIIRRGPVAERVLSLSERTGSDVTWYYSAGGTEKSDLLLRPYRRYLGLPEMIYEVYVAAVSNPLNDGQEVTAVSVNGISYYRMTNGVARRPELRTLYTAQELAETALAKIAGGRIYTVQSFADEYYISPEESEFGLSQWAASRPDLVVRSALADGRVVYAAPGADLGAAGPVLSVEERGTRVLQALLESHTDWAKEHRLDLFHPPLVQVQVTDRVGEIVTIYNRRTRIITLLAPSAGALTGFDEESLRRLLTANFTEAGARSNVLYAGQDLGSGQLVDDPLQALWTDLDITLFPKSNDPYFNRTVAEALYGLSKTDPVHFGYRTKCLWNFVQLPAGQAPYVDVLTGVAYLPYSLTVDEAAGLLQQFALQVEAAEVDPVGALDLYHAPIGVPSSSELPRADRGTAGRADRERRTDRAGLDTYAPGTGGVMPWLRAWVVRISGGRITGEAYDRWVSYWIENGVSLISAGALVAAVLLITGAPLALPLLGLWAYVLAWPLFVLGHVAKFPWADRAPPENVVLASLVALINVIPAVLLLAFGGAIAVSPMALPALFLASIFVHRLVNRNAARILTVLNTARVKALGDVLRGLLGPRGSLNPWLLVFGFTGSILRQVMLDLGLPTVTAWVNTLISRWRIDPYGSLGSLLFLLPEAVRLPVANALMSVLRVLRAAFFPITLLGKLPAPRTGLDAVYADGMEAAGEMLREILADVAGGELADIYLTGAYRMRYSPVPGKIAYYVEVGQGLITPRPLFNLVVVLGEDGQVERIFIARTYTTPDENDLKAMYLQEANPDLADQTFVELDPVLLPRMGRDLQALRDALIARIEGRGRLDQLVHETLEVNRDRLELVTRRDWQVLRQMPREELEAYLAEEKHALVRRLMELPEAAGLRQSPAVFRLRAVHLIEPAGGLYSPADLALYVLESPFAFAHELVHHIFHNLQKAEKSFKQAQAEGRTDLVTAEERARVEKLERLRRHFFRGHHTRLINALLQDPLYNSLCQALVFGDLGSLGADNPGYDALLNEVLAYTAAALIEGQTRTYFGTPVTREDAQMLIELDLLPGSYDLSGLPQEMGADLAVAEARPNALSNAKANWMTRNPYFKNRGMSPRAVEPRRRPVRPLRGFERLLGRLALDGLVGAGELGNLLRPEEQGFKPTAFEPALLRVMDLRLNGDLARLPFRTRLTFLLFRAGAWFRDLWLDVRIRLGVCPDYYQVLGLAREATPDEALARATTGNAMNLVPRALAEWIEAARVLGDPARRARYDRRHPRAGLARPDRPSAPGAEREGAPGGIMVWLRTLMVRATNGRITEAGYDRWVAFWLENGISLIAAGALVAAVLLIAGAPLTFPMLGLWAYVLAWPLFVLGHVVKFPWADRAPPQNLILASLIALINILPGVLLLTLGGAIAVSPLALPALVLASFAVHWAVNALGQAREFRTLPAVQVWKRFRGSFSEQQRQDLAGEVTRIVQWAVRDASPQDQERIITQVLSRFRPLSLLDYFRMKWLIASEKATWRGKTNGLVQLAGALLSVGLLLSISLAGVIVPGYWFLVLGSAISLASIGISAVVLALALGALYGALYLKDHDPLQAVQVKDQVFINAAHQEVRKEFKNIVAHEAVHLLGGMGLLDDVPFATAAVDARRLLEHRRQGTGPAAAAEDERLMASAINYARQAAQERRNFLSARVGAVAAKNGREIGGDFNHYGSLHAEHYALIAALRHEISVGSLPPEERTGLEGRLKRVLEMIDRPRDAEFQRTVTAELQAVDRALGGVLKDVTLYLTLAPCTRCAEMLRDLGIARMVQAVPSVNPEHNGTALLRAAGIPVTSGTGRSEARRTNLGYLVAVRNFPALYARIQNLWRSWGRGSGSVRVRPPAARPDLSPQSAERRRTVPPGEKAGPVGEKPLSAMSAEDWSDLLGPDQPGQLVVVMATGNARKKAAWRRFFQEDPFVKLVALDEAILDVPEAQEVGRTYEENALLKARRIRGVVPDAWRSRILVMAEDSGVEVECLDGRPGIYTNRFAQDDPRYAEEFARDPAAAAMRKILDLTETRAPGDRRVQARGAMSLIAPDGREITETAGIRGIIAQTLHAQGGEWDPFYAIILFENGRTYPEMSAAERARVPSMSEILLRKIRARLIAARYPITHTLLQEWFQNLRKAEEMLDGRTLDGHPDRNDLVAEERDHPASLALARLIGYGPGAQARYNALRELLRSEEACAYGLSQGTYQATEFRRVLAALASGPELARMIGDDNAYSALRQVLADQTLLERIRSHPARSMTLDLQDRALYGVGPDGRREIIGFLLPLPGERRAILQVVEGSGIRERLDFDGVLIPELSRTFEAMGWTLLDSGAPAGQRYDRSQVDVRHLYLQDPVALGSGVVLHNLDGPEAEARTYLVVMDGAPAGSLTLARDPQGAWRVERFERERTARELEAQWTRVAEWAKVVSAESAAQPVPSASAPAGERARTDTTGSAGGFRAQVDQWVQERSAQLAREGHWFYYYGDVFLTDAVLDFIGYGEPVSFMDPDERRRRDRDAETALAAIGRDPAAREALRRFILGYTVQITDRDRNAPLFVAAANFLAGRPIEDSTIVGELTTLSGNDYLARHPWYGRTPVARLANPMIRLPNADRDRVRVLVIGGAEKYGANQKADYLLDILRRSLGDRIEIEIVVTDIAYQDEVWTLDRGTGALTRRTAFAFGPDGRAQGGRPGIVFRKIDPQDEGGNIAADPDRYRADEKYDVVINARVAVQYFRDPRSLANILANSQRHLAENGLLLYDTEDTDRVEMYLNLPGPGVAFVGALPFREGVENDLRVLFQTLGYRSELLERAYQFALKFVDERRERLTYKRVLVNLLAEVVKDQHYLAAVLLKDIPPLRYKNHFQHPDLAAVLHNVFFKTELAEAAPTEVLSASYRTDGHKNLCFWKKRVGRYGDLPQGWTFDPGGTIYRDDRALVQAGTLAGRAAFLVTDLQSGQVLYLRDERPNERTEGAEGTASTSTRKGLGTTAQSSGGIWNWLKVPLVRLGMRPGTYDRFIAFWLENVLSLLAGYSAAGVAALAIAAVTGTAFAFPLAGGWIAAWGIFFILHWLRTPWAERAPPRNLALAGVIALVNIALLLSPWAFPVILALSFVTHFLVNLAASAWERSDPARSTRVQLNSAAQDYLDRISRGDDLNGRAPDVFLVLGNPDVRALAEFAVRWREIRQRTGREVPIVLAGGRGRGTPVMVGNLLDHYRTRTDLTAEQRNWLDQLEQNVSLTETQILRYVLSRFEDVPEARMTEEIAPSTNTAENFRNSLPSVAEIVNREKLRNPSIALVTSPPLLLRAQATARKLWAEQLRSQGWTVARYPTYAPAVSEWSDAELIEQLGYVAGYPETYADHYPGLNRWSELRGSQSETNPNVESVPLTSADWEALHRTQAALKAFLDARRVSFDPDRRRLAPAEQFSGPPVSPRVWTLVEFLEEFKDRPEVPPLVTGAAGFVGSHLSDALARQGQPLVALVRSRTEIPNLAEAAGNANVYLVETGDYLAPDTLRQLQALVERSPSLYHVAAQADARIENAAQAQETYLTNVFFTGLLAAYAGTKTRMVYGSSAHLYTLYPDRFREPVDEGTPLPMSPEALRFVDDARRGFADYIRDFAAGTATQTPQEFVAEFLARPVVQGQSVLDLLADPTLPAPLDLRHGLYSLSKFIPEAFVLGLPDGHGLVLEFTNAYGPRARTQDVTHIFVSRILQGRSVYASDHARDYVYISDSISALEAAGRVLAEGRVKRNERILISSGQEPLTMSRLLEAVRTAVGRPDYPYEVRPEAPLLKAPRMSNTKARRLLGWEPRTRLEDGLRELVEEIRQTMGIQDAARAEGAAGIADLDAVPEFQRIRTADPARAEHIRRVIGFYEAFAAGNLEYFLERLPASVPASARAAYRRVLSDLHQRYLRLPAWQQQALRWEVHLHDLGFATGSNTGHETRGAVLAERIMRERGVPERVRRLAAGVLAIHTELGWVRLGELRVRRYRAHRGDLPLLLLEIHNVMDMLGLNIFSLEQFEEIAGYESVEPGIEREFDTFRLERMAKPYMGAPDLTAEQRTALRTRITAVFGAQEAALRQVLRERADLTMGLVFLTYALAARDPSYHHYAKFMKFLALLATLKPDPEAEVQCDIGDLFPTLGRELAPARVAEALAAVLDQLPDDMDAEDVRRFCARSPWIEHVTDTGTPTRLRVTRLLERPGTPDVQRLTFTVRPPTVVTFQSGDGVALAVHPAGFLPDGRSRMDFDRVHNRLLLDGQVVPFTEASRLDALRTGLPEMIAAYEAKHPDQEVVAALPNGNLGFNAWFVGVADGRVFYKADEPLAERTYDLLIFRPDGSWSVRAVRFVNRRGERGVFAAEDERDLSAEVRHGLYGQRIVKDGVLNLEAVSDQFDDLRHLLRFPMFDLPGSRQLHLGFNDDTGEMYLDQERVRDAVQGRPVALSLQPLRTHGISPEKHAEVFAAWGYRDLTGRKDPTALEPGEYLVDEERGTLTMAFLPGTHPHSLFGVTKDGRLLMAVVPGRTHFAGARLAELAEQLIAQGARDVFLWANGKDALLWQKDRPDIGADGARTIWLETILVVRPRTTPAPALAPDLQALDRQLDVYLAEGTPEGRATAREVLVRLVLDLQRGIDPRLRRDFSSLLGRVRSSQAGITDLARFFFERTAMGLVAKGDVWRRTDGSAIDRRQHILDVAAAAEAILSGQAQHFPQLSAEAFAKLGPIAARITGDPELLGLASLAVAAHDYARLTKGDHYAEGAELLGDLLPRLGLTPLQTVFIQELVLRHDWMRNLGTGRNRTQLVERYGPVLRPEHLQGELDALVARLQEQGLLTPDRADRFRNDFMAALVLVGVSDMAGAGDFSLTDDIVRRVAALFPGGGGIMPWLRERYVAHGMKTYDAGHPRPAGEAERAAWRTARDQEGARLDGRYRTRAWLLENGLLLGGLGLLVGLPIVVLTGQFLLAGAVVYVSAWPLFFLLHIYPRRAPPQDLRAAGLIAGCNLLLLIPLLISPLALPAAFLASFAVHWAVNRFLAGPALGFRTYLRLAGYALLHGPSYLFLGMAVYALAESFNPGGAFLRNDDVVARAVPAVRTELSTEPSWPLTKRSEDAADRAVVRPGTVDQRPVKAGLLDEAFVRYAQAVKAVVNPDDRPKTALYGGAGMDVSSFLLSTNAAVGYFIAFYPGLTADLLRRLPEFRGRRGGAYAAWKQVRGFGINRKLGDPDDLLAALAFELESMGVDLGSVQVDEESGQPRVRFDWAYPGTAPQPRSITFINGDLTAYGEDYTGPDPSRPRPSLMYDVIQRGFDIYYQRAGFRLANTYAAGNGFLRLLARDLRPGGFLITDDVGETGDHDEIAVDFGPDLHLPYFRDVPLPDAAALENAALAVLRPYAECFCPVAMQRRYAGRERWNPFYRYGWAMRIRQRPAIPPDLGDRLREALAALVRSLREGGYETLRGERRPYAGQPGIGRHLTLPATYAIAARLSPRLGREGDLHRITEVLIAPWYEFRLRYLLHPLEFLAEHGQMTPEQRDQRLLGIGFMYGFGLASFILMLALAPFIGLAGGGVLLALGVGLLGAPLAGALGFMTAHGLYNLFDRRAVLTLTAAAPVESVPQGLWMRPDGRRPENVGTVILDWDDTVSRLEAQLIELCAHLITHGRLPEADLWPTYTREAWESAYDYAKSEKVGWPLTLGNMRDILALLPPDLRLDWTPDRLWTALIERRLLDRVPAGTPHPSAIPGALDYIRTLRDNGIRVRVVTNNYSEAVRAQAQAFGLELAEEDIRGLGDDRRQGRPVGKREAYLEIKGDLPGESIVVVDDSLEAMIAGREAGIVTLGVTTGVTPRNTLRKSADLVSGTLSAELATWLGQARSVPAAARPGPAGAAALPFGRRETPGGSSRYQHWREQISQWLQIKKERVPAPGEYELYDTDNFQPLTALAAKIELNGTAYYLTPYYSPNYFTGREMVFSILEDRPQEACLFGEEFWSCFGVAIRGNRNGKGVVVLIHLLPDRGEKDFSIVQLRKVMGELKNLGITDMRGIVVGNPNSLYRDRDKTDVSANAAKEIAERLSRDVGLSVEHVDLQAHIENTTMFVTPREVVVYDPHRPGAEIRIKAWNEEPSARPGQRPGTGEEPDRTAPQGGRALTPPGDEAEGSEYAPATRVLRRSLWLDMLPFLRRGLLFILGLGFGTLNYLAGLVPGMRPALPDREALAKNPDLQRILLAHFPEKDYLVAKFSPEQVEVRVLTPEVGWVNYLLGSFFGYYAVETAGEVARPVIYVPRRVLAWVARGTDASQRRSANNSADLLTDLARLRLSLMIEHQSLRYYGITRFGLLLTRLGLDPYGILGPAAVSREALPEGAKPSEYFAVNRKQLTVGSDTLALLSETYLREANALLRGRKFDSLAASVADRLITLRRDGAALDLQTVLDAFPESGPVLSSLLREAEALPAEERALALNNLVEALIRMQADAEASPEVLATAARRGLENGEPGRALAVLASPEAAAAMRGRVEQALAGLSQRPDAAGLRVRLEVLSRALQQVAEAPAGEFVDLEAAWATPLAAEIERLMGQDRPVFWSLGREFKAHVTGLAVPRWRSVPVAGKQVAWRSVMLASHAAPVRALVQAVMQERPLKRAEVTRFDGSREEVPDALSAAKLSVWNRGLLFAANLLPAVAAQRMHAYVARNDPQGYLALQVERLGTATKSPLVTQLMTPGTPARRAYLRMTRARPGDARQLARLQLDLGLTLFRYMSNHTELSATEQNLNLVAYGRLMANLRCLPTVVIAAREGTSEPFRVPAALLARGRSGALGAVIDFLGEHRYVIDRKIVERFLKKGFLQSFSGAA